MIVLAGRVSIGNHGQVARHAQMDDEHVAGVEQNQDVLAATANFHDRLTGQPRGQRVRVGGRQRARPTDGRAGKLPPDQLRPQLAGYGFDFGKFRHDSSKIKAPVSERWTVRSPAQG